MKFLLTIIFFLLSCVSFAQKDSTSFFDASKTFNVQRATGLGCTGAGGYALGIFGVYQLWYKGYPLERFHGFNDNKEWLQMDKVGHAASTYWIGLASIDALRWTGTERKKSILIGGSVGLIYLTGIEVLDGFSPKWGFSPADMVSNLAGSTLVIGQAFAWDEQRIRLKFSFHPSSYAKYRPGLLGSSLAENVIKDYNGQTYWLSANISSFCGEKSCFPKWLNIAGGYGGEGMISGNENPADTNDPTIPYIKRYRQYYVSLDVDVSKIRTKSKLLRALLSPFSLIKIPAPALEINQGGKMRFYPFYF